MSLVLALDGGNTKTFAAVADEGGRILGFGRAGCADIYNAASPEAAIGELVAAAEQALALAGVGAAGLDAVTLSVAGADWPEDFALLERAARDQLGLLCAPLVVNDALGALRAGAPDWVGISIVSGTYNAVGARSAAGRVFHFGFWPDGAGAHDIAKAGLRAVYHAALGMGPETALSALALKLYGARDAVDLLHRFTRRGGLPRNAGDRFASVVLDAADAGDPAALSIVAHTGLTLGSQGRACAVSVGLPVQDAVVVLAGGVFTHPSPLLAAATMAELPGAHAARHPAPPIVGALLLALDRTGVRVDADTVAAGLPSPISSEGVSVPWVPSPSSA